jgi:DNA processing protein
VRGDGGYPSALLAVADAPSRLYVRGRLDPAQRWVAVVGARAATGRGMEIASALAEGLAARGFGVVSGGAVGIDAAAHRGALVARGATMAVLAAGIDCASPVRNRPLFDEIVRAGGALVSGFVPGTPPRRWQFVARNRLLAAVAEAVIVVEAGGASGALHTAKAAIGCGRALCAVPGSGGCEALIAEGAGVVESAADVERALAGDPRRPPIALPEPGSEAARVLAALDRAGRREDELERVTGLEPRALARALMGLELEGLALALPGRAFARSRLALELETR